MTLLAMMQSKDSSSGYETIFDLIKQLTNPNPKDRINYDDLLKQLENI